MSSSAIPPLFETGGAPASAKTTVPSVAFEQPLVPPFAVHEYLSLWKRPLYYRELAQETESASLCVRVSFVVSLCCRCSLRPTSSPSMRDCRSYGAPGALRQWAAYAIGCEAAARVLFGTLRPCTVTHMRVACGRWAEYDRDVRRVPPQSGEGADAHYGCHALGRDGRPPRQGGACGAHG